MYQIDNNTSATSMPTPGAVGINPNGYFTNGNLGAGILPTIVDADWANAVQMELINVVLAAGLTPNKTLQNQLLQAINILIEETGEASYATSTSTPNTYTASLPSAPLSLTAGMVAFIKFTNANTGAATLNLNSLGAKNITKNGATALTSGDISAGMIGMLQYDGTEFQLINPAALPAITTAINTNIANQQINAFASGSDTGTANAYAVALSPAITSYASGLAISFIVGNTNTASASTLNVNGLGTKSVVLQDGSVPYAGALLAGAEVTCVYNGTSFQLKNPTSSLANQRNAYTYSADTGTANAYVATLVPALTSYVVGAHVQIKIANSNTGSSTINVNGLGTKTITTSSGLNVRQNELIAGTIVDLIYDGTNFKLAYGIIRRNRLVITSSTTYNPTAGLVDCDVELVGGGGGGGGVANSASGGSSLSGSGGGGGYCRKLFTAAAIGASQSVVIGAGGSAGSPTPTVGGTGGNSTFGSLTASGGAGGSIGSGGSGGAATGGDFNIPGQNGGSGSNAGIVSFAPVIPPGGHSMLGFGSPGTQSTASPAGQGGVGYGGGGGAASSFNGAGAQAGGGGTPGVCIILENLLV